MHSLSQKRHVFLKTLRDDGERLLADRVQRDGEDTRSALSHVHIHNFNSNVI